MKQYTKDHLWVEKNDSTGTLEIGVTAIGNDLVKGLTYVETVDTKLCVEGLKAEYELDIPASGVAHAYFSDVPENWTPDAPVAWMDEGYELIEDKLLSKSEYENGECGA